MNNLISSATQFNPFFLLVIGAIFVNNFVLSQFLGCCPFLGVSKKTDTALGMGLAVTFVMGIASLVTYIIDTYLLSNPAILGGSLSYLQTIVFILVIAGLVQAVEIVIKKVSPGLYGSLGVYLPLITTNCAVLGVAILNTTSKLVTNVGYAFANGVLSGVGFTVAILLMSGIRERMERIDLPKHFKGFPISLITAAIMSMAFTAFSGMFGL